MTPISSATFWTIPSFADDAGVLPKGVFSISTEGQFYLPIDKKFDNEGHVEDTAVDFNANLNSTIFPALGFLELPPNGFGMPPGSASTTVKIVTGTELRR